MPTRRIFELIIVTGMLGRPVMGSIRLWGMRTMGATAPGSVMHTAAEVAAILA
jgi:hypothetical protein